MYEYANNTTNNEIKFTKNLVCFVNLKVYISDVNCT